MTPEFKSRMRNTRWLLWTIVLFSLVFLEWKIMTTGVKIPSVAEMLKPDSTEFQSVIIPIGEPEPIVELEPEPVVELEPEPVDEWLYVNRNNVLLWPMVKGECQIKFALMQVHRGTKVLVIQRRGEWVEIEQNDQTALHTHGCIHETMLRQDDG